MIGPCILVLVVLAGIASEHVKWCARPDAPQPHADEPELRAIHSACHYKAEPGPRRPRISLDKGR